MRNVLSLVVYVAATVGIIGCSSQKKGDSHEEDLMNQPYVKKRMIVLVFDAHLTKPFRVQIVAEKI